ncbi:MAG: fluoride efflux transporter CrcB [Verrucomicrobiota bacterium]|nr:fluoride efflux transporter CrcB [Verrucomicrobiota bacterium]
MSTLILLAICGALGSLLRYHVGAFVHSSVNRVLASEKEFPYGTLFVNVFGSFILGFLVGVSIHHTLPPIVMTALGIGFCGALTTFSSLAVDVQRFIRDRRYLPAFWNLLLTFILGIGAAWLGFILTKF